MLSLSIFCSWDGLFHGWHCSGHGRDAGVVSSPQTCDGLGLSVELKPLLAVEVDIASKTSPGAGEGEHGQWYRDGDVDANLADVDLLLKLACH